MPPLVNIWIAVSGAGTWFISRRRYAEAFGCGSIETFRPKFRRHKFAYSTFEWFENTEDVSSQGMMRPGCVATGATREELDKEMHDAIEFHLEGRQLTHPFQRLLCRQPELI
jgi:hypothetical protein